MPFIATSIEPEVLFFIPTGHLRPDAKIRCSWSSTLRAPIADEALMRVRLIYRTHPSFDGARLLNVYAHYYLQFVLEFIREFLEALGILKDRRSWPCGTRADNK